jgi:hypothetical protein
MKRGRVKKMLFDDLVESIKEAGRIHRGEIPPSREFVCVFRSKLTTHSDAN